MRKIQILSVMLAAFAMITVGLVWTLGPWALVACGAVLLVSMFFVDVKEDENG